MTSLQQEILKNPGAVLVALSTVLPEILEPQNGNAQEIEDTPKLIDPEKQIEIVDGKVEIKEVPGLRSSGIATRITVEIGIYLKTNKIGRLYGSDATFTTINQNERMADVAFVSNEKLREGEPVTKADFAPDLAVEVISPSDKQEYVTKKINEYLQSGVKEVWRVEPEIETVTVYKSLTNVKVFTKNDVLTTQEILPGLSLPLNEIFLD